MNFWLLSYKKKSPITSSPINRFKTNVFAFCVSDYLFVKKDRYTLKIHPICVTHSYIELKRQNTRNFNIKRLGRGITFVFRPIWLNSFSISRIPKKNIVLFLSIIIHKSFSFNKGCYIENQTRWLSTDFSFCTESTVFPYLYVRGMN